MKSDNAPVLVVDDEWIIRQQVARALGSVGIPCDCAVNGDDALYKFRSGHHQLVVTDLRMPECNGHSLAVTLLAEPNPPMVVALTGVTEPRLARDLLARGVNDVVFKPVNYFDLADRLKHMLEMTDSGCAAPQNVVANGVTAPSEDASDSSRGRWDWTREKLEARLNQSPQHATNGPPHDHDPTNGPINLFQLNHKISQMATILPISNAALDVYEMTRNDNWHVSQIAAAIQRDATLTAEVLRLANSSLYNQSGERLVSLDEAVVRIGQKRIGELALTGNALATMTSSMLPWMDLEVTWNRSMAAGIVLESLVEIGGHQKIEEGLLLSSIMHPLGRVALGMLFPKHYKAMIKTCIETGAPLQEQERCIFPTSHTEVMAHLLATWRIPPDVFLPLKFALDDFSAIARLSEPTRTKSELVKVAIVLARLAVGRWESWDLVQFPPPRILKRLGVSNVAEIIEQARSDLNKLAAFHPGQQDPSPEIVPPTTKKTVMYCNASGNSDDPLINLFNAMGLEPKPCAVEELKFVDIASIVNCIGVTSIPFEPRLSRQNVVIVSDEEREDMFVRLAPTVTVPNSYGRFRDAVLNVVGLQDAQQLKNIGAAHALASTR